jgi:hypothetical protein
MKPSEVLEKYGWCRPDAEGFDLSGILEKASNGDKALSNAFLKAVFRALGAPRKYLMRGGEVANDKAGTIFFLKQVESSNTGIVFP